MNRSFFQTRHRSILHLIVLMIFASSASPIWAAYSCAMTSATGTSVNYVAPTPVDANGTVTLNCTRALSDAATLTYRIKATDGGNASGTAPFRRVRLGASAEFLFYSLRRGSLGGAATCNNATNWRAPATGTTNVITGTLSFGAGTSASAVWGFCGRTRVGAGGNPALPVPGLYTDSLDVFAQYPNNNAGTLTSVLSLSHAVTVPSVCSVVSTPTATTFDYTSFRTTAATFNRAFNIACSNSLPYSIALDSSSVTDAAVNLSYTISLSVGAGVGTGANQSISVLGNMPAGQAGTCATAVCSNASSSNRTRTITITY